MFRHSAVGDKTPPTVWTLQRLPWNPGGCGMGELWGYKYTPMPTYIHYHALCINATASYNYIQRFLHLDVCL